MQFTILSPELRSYLQPDYESFNWVTGTSSPWVDQYSIQTIKKPVNGSSTYQIHYVLTDSTQRRYPEDEIIVVQQFGDHFLVAASSRFPAKPAKP